MTTVSDNNLLTQEFYIEVAETHGDDSEADHEVGDLQDFFRVAWSLLSHEQRIAFAKSTDVQATLDGAGAEYSEDLQALLKL
jgi:hypothetical protein